MNLLPSDSVVFSFRPVTNRVLVSSRGALRAWKVTPPRLRPIHARIRGSACGVYA
jgi:hypothetical protein